MYRTLFLALILAFGFSCTSSKNLFKNQDAVPADFGKEETTVLVIKTNQRSIDRTLESAFQKYYGGKYLLIANGDQYSGNYDKKTYRYMFKTNIQFVPASGMGNTRMAATNNYSFEVVDRVTQKKKSPNYSSGAYKGMIEAYVKKLEEVRKANSGR